MKSADKMKTGEEEHHSQENQEASGFFLDGSLEKAKSYAAGVENFKVLPVVICLTAQKR